MKMRVRLFPVLVAVASLALAARVTDVWQGFAVMAQDTRAQDTRASQNSSQPMTAPTQAWNGAAAAGDNANAGEQPGEPAGEGAQLGSLDAPSGVAGQGLFQMPADPLTMTDEEVTLLQALAKRRDEIERRTRRVEEREALLQAAERRIEEKVDTLKQLQQRIEDLLNQHETQTEAQYRSLVKIYENMKPKDAARIFEELEMDILLPVVERMKERKTAPILAKMNADRAKEITTELAQRRLLTDKN